MKSTSENYVSGKVFGAMVNKPFFSAEHMIEVDFDINDDEIGNYIWRTIWWRNILYLWHYWVDVLFIPHLIGLKSSEKWTHLCLV